MERFNIKQDTVLNHLYTCFQEGYRLIETDEFFSLSLVSPEKKAAILDRFDKLGFQRLSPVFKAFDGKVDYKELQILRLYYVTRKGSRGGDAAIPVQLLEFVRIKKADLPVGNRMNNGPVIPERPPDAD